MAFHTDVLKPVQSSCGQYTHLDVARPHPLMWPGPHQYLNRCLSS